MSDSSGKKELTTEAQRKQRKKKCEPGAFAAPIDANDESDLE